MNEIKLILQFFWKYTRRYPFDFGLSTLVIAQVLNMAVLIPLWVGFGVSKLSNPSSVGLEFSQILLLITLSAALGITLNRISQKGLDRLETKVTVEVYDDMAKHILSESYEFHSKSYGGALISQAGKLGGSYIQFMDTTMGEFLRSVVVLFASSITLAFFDIRLALIMFSITIFGVMVIMRMTRKRYPLQRRAAALTSKHTAYLSDMITNVTTVKTFASESTERKHYRKLLEKTSDAYLQSWNKQVNANNITLSMVGVMYIAILSYGFYGIERGLIAPAIFITAQLYAVRLTAIFWDASRIVRTYETIFANSHEMVSIMQNTPSVLDAHAARPLAISTGEVTLQDVTFNYSDADKAVINNLSLTIKAGQKVGLVGKSGGGKTTITKLLLRFMDIQRGSILIDGQDISTVTQASLRQNIAYVPQEPLLFHRSIRDNIAYSKPDATDQEVAQAAKLAFADDFIEKLPNKYQTEVGERGVKLSGGQKQRIAIARAILKDAPILVLDEATSALDSESEDLIQKALRSLMKNRTTIVIAHRLSTIQKMDRIVVIDDGQIIEEGAHEKLLQNKGMYAKLWTHQSGGFIEE